MNFFGAASVRNYSNKPSLDGNSTTYIEEMYNSWLRDPASVHTVRTRVQNTLLPPRLQPLLHSPDLFAYILICYAVMGCILPEQLVLRTAIICTSATQPRAIVTDRIVCRWPCIRRRRRARRSNGRRSFGRASDHPKLSGNVIAWHTLNVSSQPT